MGPRKFRLFRTKVVWELLEACSPFRSSHSIVVRSGLNLRLSIGLAPLATSLGFSRFTDKLEFRLLIRLALLASCCPSVVVLAFKPVRMTRSVILKLASHSPLRTWSNGSSLPRTVLFDLYDLSTFGLSGASSSGWPRLKSAPTLSSGQTRKDPERAGPACSSAGWTHDRSTGGTSFPSKTRQTSLIFRTSARCAWAAIRSNGREPQVADRWTEWNDKD